jgi:hypothetical protein
MLPAKNLVKLNCWRFKKSPAAIRPQAAGSHQHVLDDNIDEN